MVANKNKSIVDVAVGIMLTWLVWVLIGVGTISSAFAQKVKVACVGNSVTYGYGIENREEFSYPAQLQKMLGADYEVGNFGYSGATMLKNGHKPYWEKEVFEASKAFDPDIVVIHLGLNDQGNNNWPEHKEEFVGDYLEMIGQYRALPSQPKVFICRMTPTFSGHHWFEEGMRENFIEIQAKIEAVAAAAAGVGLIDLHDPLYRYPEYFPDQLHPTRKGAAVIAQKVYSAITGDHGELKVSKLYGEQMVLQRHEPIRISGTASPDDMVTVAFNGSKGSATPQPNGTWEVVFPAMEAGGPYTLSISSEHSEAIVFKEVYVGEVWLASGQSNMDFKMHQMASAETVLRDSINDQVFVHSMDPKVLKSGVFSKEDLALCNAADYFEYSGWTNNAPEVLKNFSAVAYAYAYNLQKELQVPVGVICNAVGGAPTQAFISRERMETAHETISMLNDSWMNPLTDSWVAQRKSENFNGDKYLKNRHPYDPTFLFDAGVYPLTGYNFKGVIWYQGESNAEHTELHSRLFRMLLDDWRSHFNDPEMPWYFVQLSSIERPHWGTFRDSQRKLAALSHSGMAVSSDVGHPTDVHPKQKWIVGSRLARVVLANTYNFTMEFSGPLFDFVNVIGDRLEVHFTHANGLSTTDGQPVKDIYIAGSDKVFVEAEASIKNNTLILKADGIEHPRYVRYGYSSFTHGNLTNDSGLPASTFSNE
ncbi:GDSL-type esterase/lipase family protein [Robertkochia sediminum]|uniref:GDSL-type esterase/lipase family protein n=1 Tax=Robertkochia sediminum TaxID=2785326 RepID=UPI0019346F5C|nr:GDSL-type esterase/lipase family protein [Robertkochia sediminum]MBL7473260.1 sialate O-acetylesterase [Robertkochia sediminum]